MSFSGTSMCKTSSHWNIRLIDSDITKMTKKKDELVT